MALLIDGYNLLHVTSVLGPAPRARTLTDRQRCVQHGPSGLQRAREALLRFLAASIDAADLPRTTIVFDAKDAPPGLPDIVDCSGMTVRYAREYVDADTLIEELIQAETAPRSLLVVSSDHRIQRAARRRRAAAIDSDCWFDDLCRYRSARQQNRRQSAEKPIGPPDAAEVAYWLRQFMPESAADAGVKPTQDISGEATEVQADDDLANPFPPGYGEDLLADEE